MVETLHRRRVCGALLKGANRANQGARSPAGARRLWLSRRVRRRRLPRPLRGRTRIQAPVAAQRDHRETLRRARVIVLLGTLVTGITALSLPRDGRAMVLIPCRAPFPRSSPSGLLHNPAGNTGGQTGALQGSSPRRRALRDEGIGVSPATLARLLDKAGCRFSAPAPGRPRRIPTARGVARPARPRHPAPGP